MYALSEALISGSPQRAPHHVGLGGASGHTRFWSSSDPLRLTARARLLLVPLAFLTHATCDDAGVPPSSGTSSYATAKWRIYTDRALRAAQSHPPDYAAATLLLRTALAHAISGFGVADPHVAAAKQNLAEILRLSATDARDPQLGEAIELYADALKVLVDAYGYTDMRVGALLHNMAGVYVKKEDWAEAERCYEEALFVKRRVFGGSQQENGNEQVDREGMVMGTDGDEERRARHQKVEERHGSMKHRDVQMTERHLNAIKARRKEMDARVSSS